MSLKTDGFAIITNALNGEITETLLDDLLALTITNRKRGVYGVRNLLNLSPKILEFSKSKIVREIVENILGKDAKIVRAIYFDKTEMANWNVPWHQDLTIAVSERHETNGFTIWTKKAGIHHVQPPTSILERMLTLRFHLDDADETNGALKVFANSHKFGRLTATEIANLKSKERVVLCEVKKGDCFLMKPLLVHSSSAGLNPSNRRVIHLEFSADNLPNGLQFYGS
jgi:ectoine hydroxylase-related dioxygenase (phytanoyl-CoA dioxygenase family)